MVDLTREIDAYLKRLFALCRSITGNGNRETLRILQELIPLTVHEVPSGTSVYDWVVPDEWNIYDAWIADRNGRRIVDFNTNNLHIVSYSEPVNRIFTWEELRPHLHVHPELPEAIPYRTSYYKRDWGFCITHAQYQEMKQLEGPFEVVIDSTLKAGSLTYGELLLSGQSKQEILLSTYICHPSMANDNLSGVLLTAFLARDLMNRSNHRYSYRVIFVPETIGAIAYCARNEAAMKRIDTGLVITTVGGPGKFGYKQSFDKEHAINLLIEEVFSEADVDYLTYPFDIHGSDERQYSSQGFRINVASITKDKYYKYPYYHTSLDNLKFVNGAQINSSLQLYLFLIEKLEMNQVYKTLQPHCEIMLSKHDLYHTVGGLHPNKVGEMLNARLWLLFLCDGQKDLIHVSARSGLPLKLLHESAQEMVRKGVLKPILK